jgi:hypothetical protein
MLLLLLPMMMMMMMMMTAAACAGEIIPRAAPMHRCKEQFFLGFKLHALAQGVSFRAQTRCSAPSAGCTAAANAPICF